MKEGVERFFITDINNPAGSALAQSTIPVCLDAVSEPKGRSNDLTRITSGVGLTNMVGRFNHIPGGSNVLYADGHVEWLKFPSKFPLTHGACVGSDFNGNTPTDKTFLGSHNDVWRDVP
jgi:prepilin-type processing-associated H-X9-DG protein